MFKKRVIIAHTDIAAAASRAVFGIEHKVAYRTLDIPELADSKPACVRDQPISVRDQDFDQLQILNCSYEELFLNTVLSGENCHHVINKIINECTESNVEQVIVAAAIRSDPNRSHQLEGLYETCINLAPDTEYPALPSDARISDPVLNILLQFLIVEKIPTRCLLVAGHKAAMGTANREDGSLQSIERLQEAVTSVTGLKFSLEISKSLVYKGTNATEDEMSTMIYM